MSLAQGSCTVAASSWENHSNKRSTAKGNVNVKKIIQAIVQHLAFQEINSILTTTNQEQLTYIVLVVSSEIPEFDGGIYPSSFLGNCQTISHKC